MDEERPSYAAGRAAAVAVGLCTLLVALLVTWGATVGPGSVLEGDGPTQEPREQRTVTSDAPSSSTDPETGPENAEPAEGSDGSVFTTILSLLLIAFAIAVPVAFVLAVRRLPGRRELRRREPEREHVDFDPLAGDAEAARRAMVDEVAERRTALLEGDARHAIVRCWHEFETRAAAAGVPRERWETSSEHAERVLRLAGADQRAVSELAAVFREARFSRHPVAEDVRARAVHLLDEIHRSLARSGAES